MRNLQEITEREREILKMILNEGNVTVKPFTCDYTVFPDINSQN